MAQLSGYISLLIILSNLILSFIPCASGRVVPEPQDCTAKFSALQFDHRSFNEYHRYYRDNSFIVLAGAGVYTGADAIKEYFKFSSDESPYVSEISPLKSKLKLKKIDKEAGTCIFVLYFLTLFKSDPKYAQEATGLDTGIIKIFFDYEENYISTAYVHLPNEFLDFFFDVMTNTDQTRNYICDISASCEGVNTAINHKECTQNLQKLPVRTNGIWFDGNDQGCRVLHAFLARENQNHCPDISFEPQEDKEGNIKCQTSKGITTKDLFDEDDMQGYHDFSSDNDLDEGFKLLDLPPKTSTWELVVLGLIVPLAIFSLSLFVLSFNGADASTESNNKKRDEPRRGSSNDLAKNKARRLFVIGFLWVGLLVVANGLAALIIWAVFGNDSEHTDNDYTLMNNQVDLRDSYHGPTNHISQTDPFGLMSENGFKVYTGFIVWITCDVAGFGVEVFVHHYFTRDWSHNYEAMWRFAQFLFPLMSLVSLGLASHQNFLSLLILVPGLWKFGFPESILHLYVSLYGTNLGKMIRVADFLNGAGTIIHHGAASLLISMLNVGAFPATRDVYSPILILVMQHWIVMLGYVSPTLYCSLQLVLEYFFQWTTLSSFNDLYKLHWVAGLAAACMLFAHWLYLIAAATKIFAPDPEDEGKSNRNIHERSHSMMGRKINGVQDHTKQLFNNRSNLTKTFRVLERKELVSLQALADDDVQEALAENNGDDTFADNGI